ncbi:hypothetical protein HYU14_05335 [Candidatus Woesearchaeota archaeon]|nr:hypothetical protein [Candidatus Woesearchaeota archaeon]
MRKCKVCEKGNLTAVEDIIVEIEGYVFVVRGERCDACKEEFPYEEDTNRTIITARKLGIWPEPLKLHRHLSKSAGGLVLPAISKSSLTSKSPRLLPFQRLGVK